MQVSECYHREDSYSFETSPQGRSRWSTAFGLQRSALAAALRAMPGLRSLDCGGMQLRAKDLAALTALTCLKLGGVVLAEPSAAAAAAAAAGHNGELGGGGGGGGRGPGGGGAAGPRGGPPGAGGTARAGITGLGVVGGGGASAGLGGRGAAGPGVGTPGTSGSEGAATPGPSGAGPAAAVPALVGSFVLPPQLRELHFGRPPSPRQLAALRAPPCLCKVVTTRLAWESPRAALTFNVRDVCSPDMAAAAGGGGGGGGGHGNGHGHGHGHGGGGAGAAAAGNGAAIGAGAVGAGGGGGGGGGGSNRLLPDTTAIVAAAAALLAGRVPLPPSRQRIAVVSCDSGPGRLLPPEGQADGHACWLPALAALGVEELVLGDMALGLRDLLGLVEGLPGLKVGSALGGRAWAGGRAVGTGGGCWGRALEAGAGGGSCRRGLEEGVEAVAGGSWWRRVLEAVGGGGGWGRRGASRKGIGAGRARERVAIQ